MARTNSRHTFIVIQDVYKEGTEKAKGKGSNLILVRKNAEWEVDFYINDICGVEQILSKKAYPRTDICKIMHRDKGDFIVKGSKREISKLVFGCEYEDNQIGFKHKDG